MSIEKYAKQEFCGTIIRQREDGYLNATDMCKINNKRYNDYIENKTTKEYLKELSSDTGILVSQLVEVYKGKSSKYEQGTWVHPHVAIHLAQWLSPKFSVAVSKWVLRFIYGDLTLVDEIKMNNQIISKQLEDSKMMLIERTNELEKQKKVNIQLNNYVSNVKQRNKEEIIYIATTKDYASKNYFKVGGCESKRQLKKRLNQYNTGRPSNDMYYYAFISTTNCFVKLENRIKDILFDFLENKDKEMYVIHYKCLKQVVDVVCNNYNNEIGMANDIIKNIMDGMLSLEPEIPDKVNLNDEVIIEYARDGIITDKVRLEIKDNDMNEVHKRIQNFIDKCAKEIDQNYEFSKDKDTKELCIKWTDVFSYLNTFRKLPATEWKKLFIDFYTTTKPKRLNIKGIGLPPLK